uniref:Uncharacterized protein n=1 Tax=Romanomermis culicivorax TaxID=13658 RepID=A0A915KBU0_ROMCU
MTDENPTSSITINNNNIKFGTSEDDMIEQQIEAAIDLPICLHVSTKFAFCSYAATIMRLDFVEDWGKEFCLAILNLLVKHFRLDIDLTEVDDASPSSGKVHEIYECFEPPNVKNRSIDIVEYVQDIKSDPFIQQNGVLTIIADLITIFLKTGCYDARYRILLKHMCAFLAVSWDNVEQCEEGVVHLLEQATSTESEEDARCRKHREKVKKLKRYLMIGAGSAVGGVLIGMDTIRKLNTEL